MPITLKSLPVLDLDEQEVEAAVVALKGAAFDSQPMMDSQCHYLEPSLPLKSFSGNAPHDKADVHLIVPNYHSHLFDELVIPSPYESQRKSTTPEDGEPLLNHVKEEAMGSPEILKGCIRKRRIPWFENESEPEEPPFKESKVSNFAENAASISNVTPENEPATLENLQQVGSSAAPVLESDVFQDDHPESAPSYAQLDVKEWMQATSATTRKSMQTVASVLARCSLIRARAAQILGGYATPQEIRTWEWTKEDDRLLKTGDLQQLFDLIECKGVQGMRIRVKYLALARLHDWNIYPEEAVLESDASSQHRALENEVSSGKTRFMRQMKLAYIRSG
jgi:hypothetical protein